MVNFIMLFLAIQGPGVNYADWNTPALKMFALHGPVKSLHEHAYNVSGKPGALVKGTEIDSEAVNVMFDRKGVISEMNWQGGKVNFSYDSLGRVVETHTYRGDSIYLKTIFNYNAQGKLSEENYTYLKDGKKEKIAYLYNAQGLVVESHGNVLQGHEDDNGSKKFEYDKNGNMIGTTCIVAGQSNLKIKYKNDEYGNATQIVETTSGDRWQWNYEYIYDAHGNYTSQTEFKLSSDPPSFDELPYTGSTPRLKPVEIIERSIEYY